MSMFKKTYAWLAIAALAGVTTATWAEKSSQGTSESRADTQFKSGASTAGEQSGGTSDLPTRPQVKDQGSGDYQGQITTTDRTHINSPNSVMSGADRDRDLNRGQSRNRDIDRQGAGNVDQDMSSDRMERSSRYSARRGRSNDYNVRPSDFDLRNESRQWSSSSRRSSTGMRNADRESSSHEGSGMRSSESSSTSHLSRGADVKTGKIISDTDANAGGTIGHLGSSSGSR
jgi:hypothetical protein